MKKVKRGLKRIAAFALAVILAGTTVDLSTFAVSAAEGTQTEICEHHTEHTAECGYVEAVAGRPCTHVHDEACGYDTVSGNEACSHVHDEICGYAEAVEGTPCSYVCESCAEEENEEQQENEAAECTCGTDDTSIHATNCAVYVAPENPVCTCVEKCAEANVWCDVCGFDYTQCGGTDSAAAYAEGAVASVTVGGTTTSYTTFTDAINAVKSCTAADAAVVKLLADIALGDTYQEIEGGVFTLDLNGKILSNTETNGWEALEVRGGAQLTIIDSGTGGTIQSATGAAVCITEGDLIVKSGTLTGRSGVSVTSDCSATINGGNIHGTEYGIYCSGTVTVYGGTVTSDKRTVYVNSGSVTINSGNFTGSHNAVYIGSKGSVTINGGSFTGGSSDFSGYGSVSMTGATFPGGITLNIITLDAALANGQAYWAGDTMLAPADGAKEITDKGDITVKAACTHDSGSKSYTDNGDDHTYMYSCCNLTVTEGHTYTDGTCTGCGKVCPHSYGDWASNGDGTHSRTCTICNLTVTEDHTLTYIANDDANTITESCDMGCGYSATITLKAPANLVYDGTKKEATVEGTIFGTYAITYNAEPVNAGDYTATLTIGEKSVCIEFTIAQASVNGATVNVNDTYTYTGSDITPDVTVTLGEKTLTKDTDYTVSYSNNIKVGIATVTITGEGNYTGTASATFTIVDETDPTGEIVIKDNSWKQFLNTITFGLFFKDNVDVTITADGTGSDVAKVEYLLSGEALTEENIPTEDWTELTAKDGKYSFTITSQNKTAVYVRITDKSNNVAVINSDGIVIYADSTISPETVNYVYKENADHMVQITMNGNTFAKLTDGAGNEIATDNYTIDDDGKLTLKAAYLDSLDVGEYTYKIYMNPQGVETTEETLAYTFTVNVIPKELTVTGATATSRDYNETNTVEITNVTLSGVASGDTVVVDVTGLQGTLSSANAGTYKLVTLSTLTLTGTDAGNYTLVQPTEAVATSVEISKADAEITVATTEYEKTYGNSDFTLDVTDTNAEANVIYESSNEDVVTVSNGTVTIKGAGTATITVSLAESTNYNAAESKKITVNVAKATYSVEEINKSYLYSRENADSINLAELLPADCGTVKYYTTQPFGSIDFSVEPSVTDDGILSYTVASGGTIGTIEEINISVETQNYVTFTITVNVELIDQIPVSPKEGTEVTLKNNTLTYGEALSKLEFNSVVFVGTDGKEVAGTLAWKEPSTTPDAGTASATWVFTPSNEEYASLEGTVAITVNKATPTVSAVPTIEDRVYNPSVALKDIDLEDGAVSVPGTWSWQTANTIPVVNNSGYVAVFTPSDITNYETVTRTITVNVTKATPHVESVVALTRK